MVSSRRRKCVFTDRPLIWRQKTLYIDEFSNTNRDVRYISVCHGDVMRSRVTQRITHNASNAGILFYYSTHCLTWLVERTKERTTEQCALKSNAAAGLQGTSKIRAVEVCRSTEIDC